MWQQTAIVKMVRKKCQRLLSVSLAIGALLFPHAVVCLPLEVPSKSVPGLLVAKDDVSKIGFSSNPGRELRIAKEDVRDLEASNNSLTNLLLSEEDARELGLSNNTVANLLLAKDEDEIEEADDSTPKSLLGENSARAPEKSSYYPTDSLLLAEDAARELELLSNSTLFSLGNELHDYRGVTVELHPDSTTIEPITKEAPLTTAAAVAAATTTTESTVTPNPVDGVVDPGGLDDLYNEWVVTPSKEHLTFPILLAVALGLLVLNLLLVCCLLCSCKRQDDDGEEEKEVRSKKTKKKKKKKKEKKKSKAKRKSDVVVDDLEASCEEDDDEDEDDNEEDEPKAKKKKKKKKGRKKK